jgi:hypothetical protein|tara:strand:+ start:6 stop:293 length:288 start_codon:yes stop_codon:yes gene_type:complete
MTYVFEYVVGSDNVKVEYCFSSISNSIKVVEMWVNGKFHRTNWMSPEGNKALMARLEADYKSRVDVDSFIDDITKASYESEMDLDRDTPDWLGHS